MVHSLNHSSSPIHRCFLLNINYAQEYCHRRNRLPLYHPANSQPENEMRAVNDNPSARFAEADAQIRKDAQAVLLGITALKANLGTLASVVERLENQHRR
jgi:hypothetical protein